MKKPVTIFIALCVFHLLVSTAMSAIAHSSFLTDYHNGQGLWYFSLDSIDYHQRSLGPYETLGNGNYSLWWNTDSYRHTEYIGLMYFLFSPSPLSFAPVNAIAWSFSIVCIYLISMILTEKNHRLSIITATIFGLWPSNLLHATQLLRDPFFNLGVLAIILGWVALLSGRRNTVYSFLIAGGIIFSAGIRAEPFLLLVFCSCVAVISILFWERRTILHALFALGLTGIFYGYPAITANAEETASSHANPQNEKVNAVKAELKAKLGPIYSPQLDKRISIWFAEPFQSWTFEIKRSRLFALATEHGAGLDSFLSKWQTPWEISSWIPAKLESQVIKASSYRNGFTVWYLEPGDSLIDNDIIFRSINDIFDYIPRALVIGFFAPFPNHWFTTGNTGGRAIRLLGGMEMLVWYILMVGFVIFLVRSPLPFYIKVWLLIFMVTMILSLSIFVPNLGTLFRMRFIYMAPILIGGVYGIMSLCNISQLNKRAND